MARLNAFSCFILLLLCASTCKGNWCVVRDSAPVASMQGFLDDVCKVVDCGAVNPGGFCYEPNTLKSHTSFVLNLNYKKNNVCPQDIGIYVSTDPSFGYCIYPN